MGRNFDKGLLRSKLARGGPDTIIRLAAGQSAAAGGFFFIRAAATGSEPFSTASNGRREIQEAEDHEPTASGRSRLTLALLSLLTLAAFSLLSERQNPLRPISDYLADPERYDGRRVQVTDRIEDVGEGGFRLRNAADGSAVRIGGSEGGEVREEDVGLRATVTGTFHRAEATGKEGAWIEAEELYVARGRPLKIYASLPPLLFVVVLLLRRFRFRRRRGGFVERRHA